MPVRSDWGADGAAGLLLGWAAGCEQATSREKTSAMTSHFVRLTDNMNFLSGAINSANTMVLAWQYNSMFCTKVQPILGGKTRVVRYGGSEWLC